MAELLHSLEQIKGNTQKNLIEQLYRAQDNARETACCKNENQDQHSIAFEPQIMVFDLSGKEPHQDLAPVQGRQGDEIKKTKNQVNKNECLGELKNGHI